MSGQQRAHAGSQTADAEVDIEATVARLYREHAKTALKLALRYGRGNRSWAEDIVHDVFVEVHRHVLRLAQMENPGGWIARVTSSRCLNRLRRERWFGSPIVRWMLGERTYATDDLEHANIVRGELGTVFDAVNRLPDAQRLCVWMRHVDGMTQDEIGDVLGFRKSYVCKLLQRAEATLAVHRGEEQS